MVAVSLSAYSNSLGYGNYNLTKNWCVLQHSKFAELVNLTLSCAHTPRFSSNATHGKLTDWDPVIAVANSADRHGRSIGQELLIQILFDVPSKMWGYSVMFVERL